MVGNKIKNLQSLATSDSRLTLLKIIEAGLEAIDTKTVVAGQVTMAGSDLVIAGESFDLKEVNRLFVFGVGKCALDAAEELERILGERLSGGRVIDLRSNPNLKKIISGAGNHPLPTARNVEQTKDLIAGLTGLSERDLVIFVVSGGGSTLLCQPGEFKYEDEAAVVELLFNQGATIQELNTLRKHLSLARGGQLAKTAFPARVVSLIFSDVPGDDLSFIASGPLVRDNTTTADARMILERYDRTGQFDFLREKLLETPKEEKYFTRVTSKLLVSNRLALEAMMAEARRRGFEPDLRTTTLAGEAAEVAGIIVKELHAAPARTALLYGGETTVTVRGEGTGGRNLTIALAALPLVMAGEMVSAIASDGQDNTAYAGALADTELLNSARAKGLAPADYLARSDSFGFFNKLGYHIDTGPTGSNVSDLIIALKN